MLVFVTVCVAGRRPLLANAAAHNLLRDVWAGAARWRVGRYVVMPDHIHLFCAPGEWPPRPLGDWIQYWKNWTTRRWPSKGDKPIWQGNFWDTQLRRGELYAAKWQYVLENPVRAGLCATAGDWAWQGEINRLEWHE